MVERKHLEIVRAVQRAVAAAKELTDAERALKRPRKKAPREQATRSMDGTAQGQDARDVSVVHISVPLRKVMADIDSRRDRMGVHQ